VTIAVVTHGNEIFGILALDQL